MLQRLFEVEHVLLKIDGSHVNTIKSSELKKRVESIQVWGPMQMNYGINNGVSA